MISKKNIEQVVEKFLSGTNKFLVEIKVSSANVIDVYVDGDDGISISECVAISRQIERTFDREQEDYELHVSSPGLTKPFVLLRQYEKYIGREIKVLTMDDEKKQGVLKSVSNEEIEIEFKIGKKGQEIKLEKLLFDNIKEAKPVISFK
jgi:ribosome maturation factor RimP